MRKAQGAWRKGQPKNKKMVRATCSDKPARGTAGKSSHRFARKECHAELEAWMAGKRVVGVLKFRKSLDDV